ncbi:hypothetical protein K6025_00390 [Ehrlichia sp. JZT12]
MLKSLFSSLLNNFLKVFAIIFFGKVQLGLVGFNQRNVKKKYSKMMKYKKKKADYLADEKEKGDLDVVYKG